MQLRLLYCLLILCFSCKTTKNINALAFTTLNSFIVKREAEIDKENQFLFFSNEESFRNIFTLTKNSPGHVDEPNFSTQHIISVILQPTTDIIELKFHKIEIEKDNLNVYYITLPIAGKTFLNRPFIAATIPKFDGLKYVHYYNGSVKEKTLFID